MIDANTLPVSGSFLIACALYAGASLYAGQVIGARAIDKSDWGAVCEAGLKAEIESRKPRKRPVARTDCAFMLGWLHPEFRNMCWHYGNPDLAGPMAKAGREANERARELERKRLERAAERTGSRCECAKTVYLRQKMVSLGVYAGTARLISPSSVTNMQPELGQSLAAPVCAAMGG